MLEAADRPGRLTAFVGLDGFVDEILHVVDKREDAAHFHRLSTIDKFAERLAAAAGRSTNIELVPQRIKLGGNGPIMANALAAFGVRVTYLGNVGYPAIHPVFSDLCKRAEVYSIAEPGHTDALEFEDGKIMLGKHSSLREITWDNILSRFGREKLQSNFNRADLVAFVNWTMIPQMSEIWEALLKELCPQFNGPRRRIFFDLADPEKRCGGDLWDALKLVSAFQSYFDVTIGLNQKEAFEVGAALGLTSNDQSPKALANLAREICDRLQIHALALHPVSYALAVRAGKVDMMEGPYIPAPLITTGAGDHFNAGFCLGELLGFENVLCVLLGVATSGYYVRSAQSPGLRDLAELLRSWPTK